MKRKHRLIPADEGDDEIALCGEVLSVQLRGCGFDSTYRCSLAKVIYGNFPTCNRIAQC